MKMQIVNQIGYKKNKKVKVMIFIKIMYLKVIILMEKEMDMVHINFKMVVHIKENGIKI